VASNNQPQITSVTSETLQQQIRNLLPSQEGFGFDLMAQNVIVPIVDLTSAAEGSTVPQNLQTAFAFGSQTPFDVSNTSTDIINNTGFYRVFGAINCRTLTSGTQIAKFDMSNGLSTKSLVIYTFAATNTESHDTELYDFVVFLKAGETFAAVSDSSTCSLQGSTRQIADVNGVLVNPSGFSPQ